MQGDFISNHCYLIDCFVIWVDNRNQQVAADAIRCCDVSVDIPFYVFVELAFVFRSCDFIFFFKTILTPSVSWFFFNKVAPMFRLKLTVVVMSFTKVPKGHC